MDERTERLQERFKAIGKAIAIATTDDLAFCAKIAAWGMVMEHIIEELMRECSEDPTRLSTAQSEIGPILQSFFTEIALHLKVDPDRALDLVGCFHEVMRDILGKRG